MTLKKLPTLVEEVIESDGEKYYVARYPFIKGLCGTGDSYKEAIQDLEEASVLHFELLEEDKTPLLTVADFKNMKSLIKINPILAGTELNVNTISTKIQRNTEFTFKEGGEIHSSLLQIL